MSNRHTRLSQRYKKPFRAFCGIAIRPVSAGPQRAGKMLFGVQFLIPIQKIT